MGDEKLDGLLNYDGENSLSNFIDIRVLFSDG